MNLINRLLVIAQLLVVIAVMPIAIVLVLFFRSNIAFAVNNLANGPNTFAAQTICVSTAIIIFVVAILLLFLELQRTTTRRLRVQVADGQVEVTADAICQRLEHAIASLADVVKVRPRVVTTRKGGTVDLFLELETSPEVNVPQKTQEVIGAAKQVVEERVGLRVGKVIVQLDHTRPQKPIAR
jgi:hypothetical protein